MTQERADFQQLTFGQATPFHSTHDEVAPYQLTQQQFAPYQMTQEQADFHQLTSGHATPFHSTHDEVTLAHRAYKGLSKPYDKLQYLLIRALSLGFTIQAEHGHMLRADKTIGTLVDVTNQVNAERELLEAKLLSETAEQL
jgi:hypothetical protein